MRCFLDGLRKRRRISESNYINIDSNISNLDHASINETIIAENAEQSFDCENFEGWLKQASKGNYTYKK